MKGLQRVKRFSRAGFTLVELLIVIAIFAVLSTVLIPSMYGFVQSGQHINRSNIARTIYLAAQNQLNKSRLDKNLKSTISGYYYVMADGQYTDTLDSDGINRNNVALALESCGVGFPSSNAEDEKYIHYISKPKDYVPTDVKNELNDFYKLLDGIILEKEILQDAILMEYNIETGVILSIFYGDAGQTEFIYSNDSNDHNNVAGRRGLDYIGGEASARKQGYYGAAEVGATPPPVETSEYIDSANIYDGADVGRVLKTTSSGEKRNILYAEFLIAIPYSAEGPELMPNYTFELVAANNTSNTIVSIPNIDLNSLPTDFDEALSAAVPVYRDAPGNRPIIQDGINIIGVYFNRYIWIIEYIEGDTTASQPNSLIEKYPSITSPTDVRAKSSKNGTGIIISPMIANTHFFRALYSDGYEVKSARHLNNIRYKPSSDYRQTADIDMALAYNVITDFAPIKGFSGEAFSGNYNAVRDTLSQYRIINLNISAVDEAGLFSENAGTIQSLELSNSNINAPNVGTLTVKNTGTISRVVVSSSGVAGVNGSYVGGIVGINSTGAVIKDSLTRDVRISSSAVYVGGIAGRNDGRISCSAAEYCYVNSDGSAAGGIAGNNSGIVEDVYFLASLGGTHISNQGGGIVGYNDGTVRKSLYLAPAPNSGSVFSPIVGDGTDCTDSFFLMGHRYSSEITSSLPGSWPSENLNFNRSDTPAYYNGGGRGLVTDSIDREWISTAYSVDLSSWMQTPDYPYPILQTLATPKRWLEAASPIRPNQVASGPWGAVETLADGASSVDFVNGGFNSGLLIGGVGVPFYNNTSNGNGWINAYTSSPRGVAGVNGGDGFWVYYHPDYIRGWKTRPVEDYDSEESRNNWTFTLSSSKLAWQSIEFQRPNSSADSGRARITYDGNVNTGETAYAELNAELQSTLYQVARTVIGQKFYYSFNHLTRPSNATTEGNSVTTDRMSFYLTPLGEYEPDVIENSTERQVRDANLLLIRPCWSPRQYISGKSGFDKYNAAARNSVDYDSRYKKINKVTNNEWVELNQALKKYWDDKPEFASCDWTRPVYVYDVWVGNNTDGYGITFWSNVDYTVGGASSNNNNIALSGILKNDYDSKNWNWLQDAKTKTFGYWGVNNGWKHYYGLYTVPFVEEAVDGRVRTEFAFQSNSGAAVSGNYLAGISFKSPAFLSIQETINDSDDQLFVKQGDEITIKMTVANLGEVPANNIVITNALRQYSEYIDYVDDDITVKKGNTTILGSNIVTPNAANNYTLKITLPTDVTLNTYTPPNTSEVLTVSFKIGIRTILRNLPGSSTLLYYAENQAFVEYKGDTSAGGYPAYKNTVRSNYSNQVKINIDPVKLTKEIETVGNVLTPDPLIGGPFKITLTLENMAEVPIETKSGLLTDIIPKDYKLTSAVTYGWSNSDGSMGSDGLPIAATRTINTDGSSRISIKNANLTNLVNKIYYTYVLEYTGEDFGVSKNSSADYRYLFSDGVMDMEVKMDFPSRAVGFKVKAESDGFTSSVSANTRDMFIIKANDYTTTHSQMSDAGYVGSYKYILTDSHGNPMGKDVQDNYFTSEAGKYKVTLDKTNFFIYFTPEADLPNSALTFYYKIELIMENVNGNPRTFVLDSEVVPITINYIGADLPVYYEKYDDSSYGFYAKDGAWVPNALDDSKKIIESGYGVISTQSDRAVQLGSGTISNSQVVIDSYFLYKINASSVNNYDLLDVKSGTAGNLTLRVKIHPNFAKAIYPSDASGAGNTFIIRSAQQMRNIGLLDSTGKTFNLETDLDFNGLNLDADGAAVAGIFKGTFNGGNHSVSNLTINSPSKDNVGLFSQNKGTIKNLTLKHISFIKGKNNVGGIAGYNQTEGGRIENCAVRGISDNIIRIEGRTRVDIIAGYDAGNLSSCTSADVSAATVS